MERTLKDLVTEREELHKNLKDLGVPEGKILNVINLLDDYQDLQKELAEARNSQFSDDAFALTTEMKANNKVPSISAFLRLFANHIAAQTLVLMNVVREGPIDDLVDRMQPMLKDVEHQD